MSLHVSWNQPAPIDIPWKKFQSGERLWPVEEGDEWGFSYLIMRLPNGGMYRCNVEGIPDHEDAEVMVNAVREHFELCIRRCMVSRPIEEFLAEVLPDLSSVMGEPGAQSVVDELATEFSGDPSFAVRAIPFTMTRAGNMMSMGGKDYPWPFRYIVSRCEAGWQCKDAPLRTSRLEAQADAQKHFDARIERLTNGPLEHRVRAEMFAAAPFGAEAVLAAVRPRYTGEEPEASDVSYPAASI